MKKLLLILLAVLATSMQAANYTSTVSGAFSAGATWIGGVAPTLSNDTWTIAAGHTVSYDVSNATTNPWGASVST